MNYFFFFLLSIISSFIYWLFLKEFRFFLSWLNQEVIIVLLEIFFAYVQAYRQIFSLHPWLNLLLLWHILKSFHFLVMIIWNKSYSRFISEIKSSSSGDELSVWTLAGIYSISSAFIKSNVVLISSATSSGSYVL